MKTKRIAAIFIVLFSIAPAAMAKPLKVGEMTGRGKTECEAKTKYVASKGGTIDKLNANSSSVK